MLPLSLPLPLLTASRVYPCGFIGGWSLLSKQLVPNTSACVTVFVIDVTDNARPTRGWSHVRNVPWKNIPMELFHGSGTIWPGPTPPGPTPGPRVGLMQNGWVVGPPTLGPTNIVEIWAAHSNEPMKSRIRPTTRCTHGCICVYTRFWHQILG